MATIGSLAVHTDEDQEDSDFFDQLESEFGNRDLGHLQRGLQQEHGEKLDEAFSKLSVGGEGCGTALDPVSASPAVPRHVVEDDIAGEEFWLEDSLVEETLPKSKERTDTEAKFAIVPDSQADFLPPNTPPAAERISGSGELPKEAVSLPGDKAPEMESAVSVEGKAALTQATDTDCQLEGSFPSDACLPGTSYTMASESNNLPCVPSEESFELGCCVLENKERTDHLTDQSSFFAKETLSSGSPCDDAPHAQSHVVNYGADESLDAQSGQGIQNEDLALDQSLQEEAPDGVPVEGINEVKSDLAGARGTHQSPVVKELQWSSFGNTYIPDAFGSYSDFYADLGNQTEVTSNQETFAQLGAYQVESSKSLTDPSLTFSNTQVGSNMGSESLVASDFYGPSADHFDETAFWNQQGVFKHGISEQAQFSPVVAASFGEPQALEYKQVGLGDAVSQADGVNYSLVTTNSEAQPHDVAHQNWEDMYPGWYFDHASNQWRQIEGWGAAEEQQPFTEEGELASVPTAQSGEGLSMGSDPIWQTSQGQAAWSGLGSNDTFEVGRELSSNDVQAVSNSQAEQQGYWEQEYPGWVYDYQAQQWRQTSDDSQSWVLAQDNKLEASQGVVSANVSQISEEGWIEQQVEPHYQSEVNENAYLPERNQSMFSSNGGVGTEMLNRGVSFNSWAEPAVGVVDVGQQGMDNMEQISNTGPWTGYQGNGSTLPTHTYQSIAGPSYQLHAGHSLADNLSFPSNPPSFFQPPNIAEGVIKSTYSSSGRPGHALVAFGFGGKIVTMKAPQLGISEPLVLQDLSQLVLKAENRGLNNGFSYFSTLHRNGLNGPLVGHGAATKDILKWVDEQIESCRLETSHCTSSEGLWVLWGVLKIACLHYGKLRLMAGTAGQVEDGPKVALGRLLMAAKSQQSHWNQGSPMPSDVLHSLPTGHQLQAAADEVRSFLMEGKRKEALQLAQQGQLWGLALVLAMQLGEKVYADTILQMAQQQFAPGSPLRTLLLVFAGQTSALFQVQSLPMPLGTHGPFSAAITNPQDSAGGMLKDWLGNLSIIAANPTKGDEQVITHLGDSLWKDQGDVAGAHTCYLVAETGFELFSKEARLCLIGADHFKYQRTFATPQAIQRTELYEYAKSLGNSQYVLVSFQPFKLLYAHMLAESGKITEASRYCQMVTKSLKSAGRGAEIEFCRQSAVALEERLRQHSQGGYSLNFSTGKLVGKVMGTIDSTIHKIIGGPPVPLAPQPSAAINNVHDWYANDPKFGSADASSRATPMIPSASNSSLFNGTSQVDVPTRSISESDFFRRSAQEAYKTTTAITAQTASPLTQQTAQANPFPVKQEAAKATATASAEPAPASSKQLKSAGPSGGGYLGRFGSQLLSKMRFIKSSNEAKLGDENKFYYDEKLKRWVEAGVDQSTEEAALPPPPIVANFNSGFGTPSAEVDKSGGNLQGPPANISSSSADLPPMPPSANQFSARGRMSGVRSRYVDTFNKGNAEPAVAKPLQASPPIVPTIGGWGSAASPSQFFASASAPGANGHPNDGSADSWKLGPNNSGYSQAEHDPMLPKNLTSSFMNVSVIQKHSSTSDIAMLMSSDPATKNGGNAFGISTPGDIVRAVSWSGDSANASASSSMYAAPHRLPNGSIAGDAHMESEPPATVLPSPPSIEPPVPFAGYKSNGVQAGAAEMMLPGSLHGAAYGEMQEVEL